MKTLRSLITRFLKSEDGPTAVEYAVMLSLIVVICMGSVRAIGNKATSAFQSVATQIAPSS